MNIRKVFAAVFLVLSAVFIIAAFTVTRGPKDTRAAASRVESILAKRMARMEAFSRQALSETDYSWLNIAEIPSDMVIYRYADDSLQAWSGAFPLINDDISRVMVFQTLTNLSESLVSPLTYVTGEPSFENYGSKWYLVREFREEDDRVICGLEIADFQDETSNNGVNPRFHLSDAYSVDVLSASGGSPVMYEGKPVFKIMSESDYAATGPDVLFIWLALFIYMIGSVFYVSIRKTLPRVLAASAGLVVIISLIFLWTHGRAETSGIFSPTLYADGPVFSSLGVQVMVAMAVFMTVIYAYVARLGIARSMLESDRNAVLNLSALLVLSIGITAYAVWAFRSVILNSNITLDLFRIRELSWETAVVYMVFISLAVSVLLLLQMARPAVARLFSFRYDVFSLWGRIFFSLALAVLMTVSVSVLGFRKEHQIEKVWANRLSMDRDISLEITLRSLETQIASDRFIASVSALENSVTLIQNRLREIYFPQLVSDYDMAVRIFNADSSPESIQYYNDRLRGGAIIAPGSRFIYTRHESGGPRYAGVFRYYNDYGMSTVMVEVEPKANRGSMGYSGILGLTPPGQVVLPGRYSYSRYIEGKCMMSWGAYAYPTALGEREKKDDGYRHFYHDVGDDEVIVISRQLIPVFYYMIAGFVLMVVLFLVFSLFGLSRVRRKRAERNYYKSRITWLLMISLFLTLVSMSALSLNFIIRRSRANMYSNMSDKIKTIRTMLEDRMRFVNSVDEISTQEVSTFLDLVSNINSTDITLYTTGGMAFRSTATQLFDRRILPLRISDKAYADIMLAHKRYYIATEKIGNHSYQALYAPVMNSSGGILAIVSAPYSDESFDLGSEAILHSAIVIMLFIILLLLSRLGVGLVVNRMFSPLSEMGRKMNSAEIGHLEYIIYDRNDEISTLVRAYNLMVHDLSDSTKKLAVAERDKAWSGMARQVAHEIKNPLTPMKLQIQRLIRMKQRGDPSWAEKFDEVSKVVLDHIDILADTANEFSTFARLYTEEPVDIDLDRLLKEEIDMFDSKEDITLQYMGLENAMISGPKPQLTRVFVNLLTNAVQAIEGQREEDIEKGVQSREGNILVSLRNSRKDGFYDVVVEDSGPGVSEENRQKLFTPNFTTKSSGTGLGLAICRNILEKCGGEISYSKSFMLGGACFTVRFPKKIII
ncbi:MAG: GHKL domain-containing protein [Bacteroidales bacterium]|nr:GHKL domain-containing protein [Bacteroidales bacterium]